MTESSGAFNCTEHKFSSGNPDEWIQHLGDKEHTHRGSSKCVTCGNMIDNYTWKGKLSNGKTYPIIVCEDCKSQ